MAKASVEKRKNTRGTQSDVPNWVSVAHVFDGFSLLSARPCSLVAGEADTGGPRHYRPIRRHGQGAFRVLLGLSMFCVWRVTCPDVKSGTPANRSSSALTI